MYRLLVVILPLLVGGCGIPLPLTIASYVADIGLIVETGKSSGEHVLSKVTGQNCSYSYLLSSQKKICLTEAEYVDLMIKLDCKEYAWNILQQPYCKETEQTDSSIMRFLHLTDVEKPDQHGE